MFLRGEPDRREPFGRFLLALQNGVPFAKAFPEAFGMEPRQMLHELAAYIRNSRFFFARVPIREEIQKVEASAAPVPYDETLARLGDLLAQHPGRSEDAEAYLAASVQRNPANVTALTSLAMLRGRRGLEAEADALLTRAVATGKADFRTDYRHGVRLMRSLSETTFEELSAADRQVLAQARAAFRSSIQKNGDFAEARVALGRTYIGERGEAVAEGIAQLEEAARRLPSRPDVLFELSRLYEAKGDRARADETLKKAVGTEAAAALTRKRDDLDLEETVARVNGLLAQGKEEEAVELFEKLVAAADPEARAILEEDLKALKAGAARNRAVKDFNRAVELANRQDYAGALEGFERVADSPDAAPQLAASARKEADRLREILARRPKKTPSRN
jgi:tetratricopeptide (TPR) repeat protein